MNGDYISTWSTQSLDEQNHCPASFVFSSHIVGNVSHGWLKLQPLTGLRPPWQAVGAAALRQRQLSEAFSYAALAPLASVFCPLAPPLAAPHLLPQRLQTVFGAGGAVAAALDCATLPWRLRQPPASGGFGRPTGLDPGAAGAAPLVWLGFCFCAGLDMGSRDCAAAATAAASP